MIKQFNTAFAPVGTAKGSKGGNALIWVLGIGVAIYIGYKYIENRNKMVLPKEEN